MVANNSAGKNTSSLLLSAVTVATVSASVALLGYPLAGVQWFEPGDMAFREAMAYHGVMIPAWMLLVLACCRFLLATEDAVRPKRAIAWLTSIASVFCLLGGFLIRTKGMSAGVVIQIVGTACADLAAMITLLLMLALVIRKGKYSAGRLAYWGVLICLSAVSLATPLGHLAGALKDFGDRIPMFCIPARTLGVSIKEATGSYIGSHSHSIVAAFLACALMIPLATRKSGHRRLGQTALILSIFLTIVATLAQTGLYQFSAWCGWEPPSLFVSGPNGMPLDDLVLSILGIGLLGLSLSLFQSSNDRSISLLSRNVAIALTVLAFLVAVVGLGIYIEFNEQFFGGGDQASGSPGVVNDLSFVRAHILFGCMIVPLLMSVILHLGETKSASLWLSILVAATGALGMFVWTFALSPILIQSAIYLTVIVVLLCGYNAWRERCI